MLAIAPGLLLFIFCVYSFFREVRLERKRFLELDRKNDERIIREIAAFLKERKG